MKLPTLGPSATTTQREAKAVLYFGSLQPAVIHDGEYSVACQFQRASEHSSDKGMVYMAVVGSVRGRDRARGCLIPIAGVEDDQEQVKKPSGTQRRHQAETQAWIR